MQTIYDIVAVIPTDQVCTITDTFDYCFTDVIQDPDAINKEYKYRIDAVDNVCNKSTGYESKLVVGVPAPVLTVTPPAIADSFYNGAQITLKADVSALSLPGLHKIKFQAVKDSIKFFND